MYGDRMPIDPISIKIISDLANYIADHISKFNTAKRDRQDRAATYFDEISTTLKKISTTLKRGKLPHDHCETLKIYASRLPDTIGDVIGMDKANEFSQELMESLKHETLGYNRRERDEMVIELEKTSGLFKGFASTLRAQKPTLRAQKPKYNEWINKIKHFLRFNR